MPLSSQPDCAFHRFIDEIKPSIEAFSPHPAALWWEPYCLLLGMRQGTIFKWRSWRKLPEDAFQNVNNLVALQQVAFLPDSATAEDARNIARRRLSEALAPLPAPKTPKSPRPRAPATDPKFRRTTDDDAWYAANLYAGGLSPVDIAEDMGCSLRTVQRLLARVLGNRSRHSRRSGNRPVGHRGERQSV